MTVDAVAVVMHDPDVSRTTDGIGLVPQLTLSDIQRLNISLPGRAARVPTLEEALGYLSGRAAADIEDQEFCRASRGSRPIAERVVEATLVDLGLRWGFAGPVIVSSFNPASIAHSRRAAARRPYRLAGLV